MSWIKPAAQKAVKYGPYVPQVWKHIAKPTQAAAQKQLASWAARRTALQHADTLTEGSALGVMHNGQRTWVVFSGEEPVAAYPQTTTPLERLTVHADLRKRITPEQARERRRVRGLRRRAGEQDKQLPRPRRRRKSQT
jgi:hypothetical protein